MGMQTGSPRSRSALSEINVTPLVDVMLVLLVIFMVTAPLLQQGIEVELPETAAASVSSPAEDPLTVFVESNRQVRIGNQVLSVSQLRSKLSGIIAGRTNKQVYLQGDRRVDYGTVAQVMAEIRAAGITNIGLMTVPVGSQ